MERGREEEMESGRKVKRGGGCFEERWMGGGVDLLIPGASVVLYIHTHTHTHHRALDNMDVDIRGQHVRLYFL